VVLAQGVVVANGKGGTGKTSLAAGLAATSAVMGWRCLAVDLDPMGTLGRDLAGIREGLDVVALDSGAGPDELTDRGADYDLVVVDTPPGPGPALDLGLAACRFVLCPVRFDQASVDGLDLVDRRRRALRGVNPDLELLGVVLFGFATTERRLLRDVRGQLEFLLDGVAPVFPTFIREARRAARHLRAHGVVAGEYLLAAEELGAGAAPTDESFARNADGLAADYWELAAEVLVRLRQRVAETVPA
jgi:cellulose biosynthesis protein BcsQ